MALLTGLVSYWKMDEVSGTRADSHGANDLTDTNTVGSVAGKLNLAANFVAVNSEELSVADNASLAFTTAFSTSFWLRQTTLAVDRAFIAKWTFQTDGEFAIQSGTATASGMAIYLTDTAADGGAQCRMLFDSGFIAGTWYHVAVVYDGSLVGNAARLKVWVDNVAKTLTVSAGSVIAAIRNGTASLIMGRFGGTLTRYLNGDMDEVGLWNRALTSTEVAQLYNSGEPLAYPFGEGGTSLSSRTRISISIGV